MSIEKKCSKCSIKKNITEFYYHRTRKKYMNSCKLCNNSDSINYQTSGYRDDNINYIFYQRAYGIIRDCKKRGKVINNSQREGLEVMEGLKDHLIFLWNNQNQKCYYTDTDLVLTGYKDGVKNAFTVDRIDSSKGYVEGNIVLCCNIINRMKQNLSLEEFYTWSVLIQQKLKIYLEK